MPSYKFSACALTLLLVATTATAWEETRRGYQLPDRPFVSGEEAVRDPRSSAPPRDAIVTSAPTTPGQSPIPIAPPQAKPAGGDPSRTRATAPRSAVSMVLGSLAIVLGAFFLVVWLARRALPQSALSLPKDVLQVMGRAPLASRHHLQLIRLGRRMLLVSVTPDGATTLADVTDPAEVDHLAALCRQHEPESISASFRSVLHQLGSTAPRAGRTRPESAGLSLGQTVSDPLDRRTR